MNATSPAGFAGRVRYKRLYSIYVSSEKTFFLGVLVWVPQNCRTNLAWGTFGWSGEFLVLAGETVFKLLTSMRDVAWWRAICILYIIVTVNISLLKVITIRLSHRRVLWSAGCVSVWFTRLPKTWVTKERNEFNILAVRTLRSLEFWASMTVSGFQNFKRFHWTGK